MSPCDWCGLPYEAGRDHNACWLDEGATEARVMHSALLGPVREAARRLGYAVTTHGTITRDIDLVAVPWVEGAEDSETLAAAVFSVAEAVAGPAFLAPNTPAPTLKPHGRLAWAIYVGKSGRTYLDLSVTPRGAT